MEIRDKIQKRVVLRAPVARVWTAISTAAEFSKWFGIQLNCEFKEGQTITGTFMSQFNEAQIMEHQEKLGFKPTKIRVPDKNFVFCTIVRMEKEKYFSFRWIPYGIDAESDPLSEPTTLVEFRLREVAEGTELTITESGFAKVPPHRRERAFRMNDSGWTAQAENVKNHVEKK